MQLEAQDYLRLVESNKSIVVLDTESFGFNADFGTLICGSVKQVNGDTDTYHIEQLGNDRKVARELKERLEDADAWVTFYGKGHDIPFINTRLLRHGLKPVGLRPHIDMYYQLKYKLKMASKSQAAFASWLDLPEKKMSVSADTWASMGANFDKNLKVIIKRCESDVATLDQLYQRCKHLIRDIKRG